MSQTVYYKFVILFLVFITISNLKGKLLRPSNNRKDKEILLINSKRRVYYPIKDTGLVYNVSGPNRIEFISRYPVLGKKKKSHSYSYNIVLNKTDTIDVNHKYKVQSKIHAGAIWGRTAAIVRSRKLLEAKMCQPYLLRRPIGKSFFKSMRSACLMELGLILSFFI